MKKHPLVTTRRLVIALVLALGSISIVAVIRLLPPRQKPETSYVVIVVDSMRADHLAAYGYARRTTPRIDALARGGVVFDAAFTQAPWTKPSVASIFTSTYSSVHRVLYSKQVVDDKVRSDILNEKFLTLAEAMKAGGYATGGFGQKIHLRPEFGFSQGFDGYDMRGGGAERVNRKTLSWLRQNDPDKFFMYLHYNDAHYPYTPRPEYAKFGTLTPRVQINGETKRAFYAGTLKLTSEDMTQLKDLYDGELLYVDHFIGELIDSIAALGYGRLVVLVTADHGEEFLDHGGITHGQSLYGELVHVPFIVGGTGLPPALAARRGQHVSAPVQLIDVMPTLIELAGMPLPPGLQGSSLIPRLGSGDDPPEPRSFSERFDEHTGALSNMVIDGRWKLINDASHGRTLLFDLASDPGETMLLQDSNADVVRDLQGRVRAWSETNQALHRRIRPDSTAPLDPEDEERLRSLGYVD